MLTSSIYLHSLVAGRMHLLSPHRLQFPQAWQLSEHEAYASKQSGLPQLTIGFTNQPPVVIAGIRTGLGTTAAPKCGTPVTIGQNFHFDVGCVNIGNEDKEDKEGSNEETPQPSPHFDTTSRKEDDGTTTDSDSEDSGAMDTAIGSPYWGGAVDMFPVEKENEGETGCSDEEWLPKKTENLKAGCEWLRKRGVNGELFDDVCEELY